MVGRHNLLLILIYLFIVIFIIIYLSIFLRRKQTSQGLRAGQNSNSVATWSLFGRRFRIRVLQQICLI